MRIVLDQDKCIASGQCVLTAPGLFDQREDDGIAVLLRDQPSAAEFAAAVDAARICPASAISIED